MRNIRPAFPRSFSRSFEALFWTTMLGAVGAGLIKFFVFLARLENPRQALSPQGEGFLLFGAMAAFGILGLTLALLGLLSPLATRYEIGATELTVRRGLLWRRTSTIPLVGLSRIEAVSGPVMRLFGLTDLVLYLTAPQAAHPAVRELPSAVLLGLRDAEEVRRYLLERRDTLHESVLRGDLSVARTPQELLMERLTAALERLEKRLPRV